MILLQHRVERRRPALDELFELRLNLRELLLELVVHGDLLRRGREIAATASTSRSADHRPHHPTDPLVELHGIAECVFAAAGVVNVDQLAFECNDLDLEILGGLYRGCMFLRVRAEHGFEVLDLPPCPFQIPSKIVLKSDP